MMKTEITIGMIDFKALHSATKRDFEEIAEKVLTAKYRNDMNDMIIIEKAVLSEIMKKHGKNIVFQGFTLENVVIKLFLLYLSHKKGERK